MESFAAFHNAKLLSRGPLSTVLPAVHAQACKAAHDIVFIQESSGRSVDFDWRGSVEEVLSRAEAQFAKGKPGRGRPKLGVQSREVTLLPRHWAWLDQQQGARSAVIRRLVDKAMKSSTGPNVDAVYGAMSTLAGDLANFEEASRALFARDNEGFAEQIQDWPSDLREYFSQWVRGEVRVTDPSTPLQT